MIRCAFSVFLFLLLLYFIGNNGYIWISPSTISEDDAGGFAQNLSVVNKSERLVVARLRNCILALANSGVMLWDTSLTYAYDASARYVYKVEEYHKKYF